MLEEFVLGGIELVCLTEPFTFAILMIAAFFDVKSAFSELERIVISERTIAGLAAARKRGVPLGRPPKLTADQKALIRMLWASRQLSLRRLAARFDVSIRTITRTLANAAERTRDA